MPGPVGQGAAQRGRLLARPVPFCRYGFLPPPRTCPRVLVAWVPCLAAACCATTTWWISGTFTFASKMSDGRSTSTSVLAAGTLAFLAAGALAEPLAFRPVSFASPAAASAAGLSAAAGFSAASVSAVAVSAVGWAPDSGASGVTSAAASAADSGSRGPEFSPFDAGLIVPHPPFVCSRQPGT